MSPSHALSAALYTHGRPGAAHAGSSLTFDMSGHGYEYGKVVLFGASITQRSFCPGGWGSRVADKLQRRADVLNRGFSGYNTEWGKLILPQLISVESPAPNAVTIFFGGNDSSLAGFEPPMHVSLNAFKANIAEMCSYLTKSVGVPKRSVIIISPSPLCDHLWAETCRAYGIPTNRRNAVTEQYAVAAMAVGSELGVSTVDLFTALSQKPSLETYLSDGLHLTAEGEEVVAELVLPLVEQALQDLPPVFPDWMSVNARNPRETFCTTARL